MDAQSALHTAARRYCQEHGSIWSRRHAEITILARHPQGHDFLPRYHVLEAILVGVEGIVALDADTLEEIEVLLINAGQTSSSMFVDPPQKELEARAMQEERDRFCAYVHSLTTSDLENVEPLPYHRTLSSSEHTKLWARLQERWAVHEGSYWHPLGSDEDPAPHVVAFQLMWFDYAVSLEKLRAALAEHGVTRVWELREYGPEYEIDVAEMEPMYNAAEGYWTSGDLDWLLNVSHESSITVAGEWLITSVQRLWPDWEQHIYEDWDYTCFRPRRGAADKARGPRRERHAPLPY